MKLKQNWNKKGSKLLCISHNKMPKQPRKRLVNHSRYLNSAHIIVPPPSRWLGAQTPDRDCDWLKQAKRFTKKTVDWPETCTVIAAVRTFRGCSLDCATSSQVGSWKRNWETGVRSLQSAWSVAQQQDGSASRLEGGSRGSRNCGHATYSKGSTLSYE